MRRIHRIIAGVLCGVLLFLQCGDLVYADPAQLTSDLDTYVSSASSRLNEIEKRNYSGSAGQYGLLTDLQNLSQYAIYTDFLKENASTFSLSQAEIDMYLQHCNEMLVHFNSQYSEDSTRYMSHTMAVALPSFDSSTVSSYVQSSFATEVYDYLVAYMDSINGLGLSDEKLESDYGSALGVLYKFLTDVQKDSEIVSQWAADNSWVCSTSNSFEAYCKEILNNSDYATMLDIGNTVANLKNDNSVMVDTSLTYIENLASVAFDTDNNLEVDTDPKLSLLYLAAFASSAVYVPFSSYTGCSEFTTALASLADDSQRDDVLLLYNSTKEYKKPLYKRTLDSSGNPTGVAKSISLADFIDDIESGNIGALCTIVGDMEEVDNDWIYDQSGQPQNTKNAVIVEDYNGTTTENQMQDSTGKNSSSDSDSDSGDDVSSTIDRRNELNELAMKWSPIVHADVRDGFSESDETAIGTSGGNNVHATKEITDESAMSAPVLLYGAKYARDTDNMTTVIMTNILKSVSSTGDFSDKKSEWLYVNAYGDIVLGNDLVVLPGAANPLYYKAENYNPFTAAFMNSYPSVLKNTSYFKLASKSDIGKYMIFGNYDFASKSLNGLIATKITSIESVTPKAPLSVPGVVTNFTSNLGLDSIKVFKTRRLIFGAGDLWNEDNQFYSYTPFLNSTAITINGSNVFPYVPSEDTDGVIAKALAQNVFTQLAVNSETNELGNQEKLNDAYMIDAALINGLNGTDDAEGYQNSEMLNYDTYTANSSNRLYNTLKKTSTDLCNRTASTSGILGIKSVYDNKIVAGVLNAAQDYRIIFLLIIIVILLFYFSKVRLDLIQCVAFALAYSVFAYLYVGTLPSFIPSAFNLVTNNVAQNLTYEILSLDAESYSFDDDSTVNLDSNGYVDYDSASINLYRIRGESRDNFLSSLNIDSGDITGGKVYVVNKEAGVYAKNDAICVNTNILFDTLKIEGKLNSSYAYTLSAKKTVSSNVDYYVPYYQIVDCLLDKINTISDIYSIPRRTSTYADGRAKNNYLLYSYINSKPFVTPGKYDYVVPTSELDWTEEELKAYESENANVSSKLQEAFGNNADWLGISNFLYTPDESMKKTLWAQTMQDLGYYDADWSPNTEKLDQLVTYVNYHTRKFVLDMSGQIGYLSDDVMIKVVSMRALIALTQRASDFGHWMYPFAINYEDMTLKNVLQSVIISDYDKYVGLNMDVVSYIMEQYGWPHLIAYDILVIFMFLTASILNICVPAFYLMLGILILARLLMGQGLKEPLKGYLKASLIVFICSTFLTLLVLLARALNGNVFALYLMLIGCFCILDVLFGMIKSVVCNLTEFGNTAINVTFANKMHRISERASGLSHRTLRAGNLIYNRSGKVVRSLHRNGGDHRYDLRTGVEDLYEDIMGGPGNYYDDYDSHSYLDDSLTEDSSPEAETLEEDEATVHEVDTLVDEDNEVDDVSKE